MAHAASYNKWAVKDLIHEHDRTAKKYKNNVCRARSSLNFTYGIDGRNANEIYKLVMERCSTIMQGKKMQDKTNVVVEWNVTYPAELCHEEEYDTGKKDKNGNPIIMKYNKPDFPEHCKDFFSAVYDFSAKRYGGDNIIGGYVHMDETTPHMHLVLVPESVSRKTGRRTVSSASLLLKKELSMYHRDLQKHMIDEFGDVACTWILNGRTKTGETTAQMKARQAKEKELADYEKHLDELDEELGFLLINTISDITGEEYSDDVDEAIDGLKDFRRKMTAEKKNIESERSALQKERSEREQILRQIDHQIKERLSSLETVKKGTEISNKLDFSKYSNIAKFVD